MPKFIQNCFPSYFKKFQPEIANEVLPASKSNGELNKTFDKNETTNEVDNIQTIVNEANENEFPEDEQRSEISETESQKPVDNDIEKYNPALKRNEVKVSFEFDENRISEGDLSSDGEDYAVLPKPPYHHIIIDCSPLNYIDTFAVKNLHQVISSSFMVLSSNNFFILFKSLF